MNCDITREQLIDYLYDEDIRPEARERLKAHIETCPSCSQTLEELGSTSRILNAWGDEKPDMDLVFVQDRQPFWQNLLPTRYPKTWATVGVAIAAILIFTFLNIEFAIQDGAFHTTIGPRSSDSPERVAIADTSEVSTLDTPITRSEFITHQQNLIDYTHRLVQESQNQQRDEINNTFIRLVSELETQRQQDLLHIDHVLTQMDSVKNILLETQHQQDLLRIDRGLQTLYNTYETRYDHILTQMDSVKNILYDNAVEVYSVPVGNEPYRTIPTRGKTP
ncbi:MAG: zf-HC2 domain-containing protein [Gemmatimonadetes bacterium]|nr:zf-HC2 domain-containing protein [Gemmatimonadota bacterium]